MEEALRRVSLLLQKKRSRNVLLVSLLLVLLASNAVVFSSRHIFTAQVKHTLFKLESLFVVLGLFCW